MSTDKMHNLDHGHPPAATVELGGDLWLFAYGSLMWHPEFEPAEARPARLAGYHRRFCLYSYSYRGRPEAPGLVLGLDRGGSCWGRAFRITAAAAGAVLEMVDGRELVNGVYHRRAVPIRLGRAGAGPVVRAHAYVVNRDHPQYAGRLDAARTVALIRRGRGRRGSCLDYLRNTVAHLAELGLPDPHLAALLRAAEAAEPQAHLE
jgi:cation transport protein ChaC